jgi:hypothetical protein
MLELLRTSGQKAPAPENLFLQAQVSVERIGLLGFDARGRSAYDLAALLFLYEYDDAQVLAFP